jgi:carboxypeptidase C (cathepsin A)
VDNESSWLDMTDLVFIDPVSTGYSRPVEGEKADQFHGLREDIQWVGDFIRLWTTKNKRWDSPKFLAGESYGTTRAAGLSGYLQEAHGMYLSGIVLISPVLNFQTIEFDTGNDTPYWLFLPSYTATAWYHGKLDADLQRDLEGTLREVEAWAETDYVVALSKGDSLSGEEREQIVAKLARYTGLSKDYVRAARLRIDESHFTRELLRDKDRSVGRYDSRYTGYNRSGVSEAPEYDPSYAVVQGAFTSALNHYVRSELNYENDRPYEILTGRVHPWSFATAQNRYAEVADTLRSAMTKNPSLRVLVCSGYYDLATPHFAATYTINHLGLPPEVQGNIRHEFYGAGHMMYLRAEDLAKLKTDAAKLFQK